MQSIIPGRVLDSLYSTPFKNKTKIKQNNHISTNRCSIDLFLEFKEIKKINRNFLEFYLKCKSILNHNNS